MEKTTEMMVNLHFEPTQEHAINHCSSLSMLTMLVKEFGADVDYINREGYWPLSSFAESNDLDSVV